MESSYPALFADFYQQADFLEQEDNPQDLEQPQDTQPAERPENSVYNFNEILDLNYD